MKKKRVLKRIDRNVLFRLLSVLYKIGDGKKSTIARKANMAYDNCILYLDFLEIFGFVNKSQKDGFEIISLTSNGINLCSKFVNKPSTDSPKLLNAWL